MNLFYSKYILQKILEETGDDSSFAFKEGDIFIAELANTISVIFAKKYQNVSNVVSDNATVTKFNECSKHNDINLLRVPKANYKIFEVDYNGDIFYVLGDYKSILFNNSVKSRKINFPKESLVFLDIRPDFEIGTVICNKNNVIKTVSEIKNIGCVYFLNYFKKDLKIQNKESA